VGSSPIVHPTPLV